MPVARLLPLQNCITAHAARRWRHSRWWSIHTNGAISPKSQDAAKGQPIQTKPQLSLFEELFPEEVKRSHSSGKDGEEHDVPRLPQLDVDGLDAEGSERTQTGVENLTKSAHRDAFRRNNLAVLVLQRASKSLVESDFRRIVPKGQHIDGWKGPGDIIKGTLVANHRFAA